MPIFIAKLIDKLRARIHEISESGVAIIVAPTLILVIIGTVVYSALEGWSLLDSLYATIITMTTVGYGDLSPQTPGGRIFAIFFTLAAIGLASYAISALAAYVIEKSLAKRERKLQERRMNQIQDLSNHVIVCGGSVIGHRTANELLKRGTPFVLIEPDEETLRWALLWLHQGYVGKRMSIWKELEDADVTVDEDKSVAELAMESNVLYLMEDPTQETALRHAGIERAQGLITAMNDDRDNMAIILSGRDMANRLNNRRLRIVSRVVDEWNMRRLSLAGADEVIAPNIRGGYMLASQMLDPILAEFWDHMILNDEQIVRFTDMHVADKPELAGKTVSYLQHELGQMTVAIKRNSEFFYAPHHDMVLETNDSIIVIGQAQ